MFFFKKKTEVRLDFFPEVSLLGKV